jgi:hypothetical protein
LIELKYNKEDEWKKNAGIGERVWREQLGTIRSAKVITEIIHIYLTGGIWKFRFTVHCHFPLLAKNRVKDDLFRWTF